MAEEGSEAFRIEAIAAGYHRATFDCGHPFLNTYLAQFARQNDRQGLARAYVLVPEPQGNPVLGHYTLTSGAVAFENIPSGLRQGLPQKPPPGRAHRRIGRRPQAAGSRVWFRHVAGRNQPHCACRGAGCRLWAIMVDPIDQPAACFYLHHGFQALPDSDALILTLRDAKAWLD